MGELTKDISCPGEGYLAYESWKSIHTEGELLGRIPQALIELFRNGTKSPSYSMLTVSSSESVVSLL